MQTKVTLKEVYLMFKDFHLQKIFLYVAGSASELKKTINVCKTCTYCLKVEIL